MDNLLSPGHGANWLPHLVSIRNRKAFWTSTNTWLSNIVVKIKDRVGSTPTAIYCRNCRDDVRTSGKSC